MVLELSETVLLTDVDELGGSTQPASSLVQTTAHTMYNGGARGSSESFNVDKCCRRAPCEIHQEYLRMRANRGPIPF